LGVLRATLLTDTDISGFAERKDRIDYRIDGSTEWTGILVQPDRNLRTGGKQIKAQGIAVKLEQSRPDYENLTDEEVSYSSIRLDQAIRNYWGRTPFSSATVTDQNTEIVEGDADIQSADTTSEFDSVENSATKEPVTVSNGKLKRAQSAFVKEAEVLTPQQIVSDSSYSDGEAVQVGGTLDIQASVDVNYEMDDIGVAMRYEVKNGTHPGFELQINGNFAGGAAEDTLASGLNWFKTVYPGGPISGSTTFRFTPVGGTNSNINVDLIVLYDRDYTYNFDDTVHQNSGYLDGPELYPASTNTDIDTISPAQQVDAAELQTTYNDTSNGQFVEVGNGTTNKNNNSENVSVDFTNLTDTINATLGLDGFGTNGSQTPRERFNGQTVDVADILVDLSVLNKSDVGRADYEVIFSGSDVNGFTLREAGQVNSNGDALTRSIFPTLEPSGEAVIFSEDLGFDI